MSSPCAPSFRQGLPSTEHLAAGVHGTGRLPRARLDRACSGLAPWAVGLAQLAGLASFSEDRLAPGRAVAAGRGLGAFPAGAGRPRHPSPGAAGAGPGAAGAASPGRVRVASSAAAPPGWCPLLAPESGARSGPATGARGHCRCRYRAARPPGGNAAPATGAAGPGPAGAAARRHTGSRWPGRC